MIVAKLRVRVSSIGSATSLVRAVDPDNLNMPGLTVRSTLEPSGATFHIKFDGKIETFISTLDDLLQCLQAAKGTIDKVIEE